MLVNDDPRLLFNTWILSDKRTESIVHVAEMMLLDALFGIHIKARPLPDGDYYEYIEDRMGNIVNLLEAMATPEEIERAYWSRDYGRVHQGVANLHRRFLTLQNESRPGVGVK